MSKGSPLLQEISIKKKKKTFFYFFSKNIFALDHIPVSIFFSAIYPFHRKQDGSYQQDSTLGNNAIHRHSLEGYASLGEGDNN